MNAVIVPFTVEHLDAAAALLAERHRAGRAARTELSPRFDGPSGARALVTEALAAGASGVAVLMRGRLAGYLLGLTVLPEPASFQALTMRPRSMRTPLAGHAASAEDEVETYRRLYAAAAPRWLANGCFAHYVQVAAWDAAAFDAWFSLGFGQFSVRATRSTTVPGAAPAAGIDIRRGTVEDIDAVTRLSEGLSRHHADSPLFLPYLAEAQAAGGDYHLAMLANPLAAYWLAFRGGRAVAMQTFHPPHTTEPDTPERSIHLENAYTEPEERGAGVTTALLDRAMAWARGAGYESCTVSWMTANLPAARFWAAAGFRPTSYRLLRVVDERVLWNGTDRSP